MESSALDCQWGLCGRNISGDESERKRMEHYLLNMTTLLGRWRHKAGRQIVLLLCLPYGVEENYGVAFRGLVWFRYSQSSNRERDEATSIIMPWGEGYSLLLDRFSSLEEFWLAAISNQSWVSLCFFECFFGMDLLIFGSGRLG